MPTSPETSAIEPALLRAYRTARYTLGEIVLGVDCPSAALIERYAAHGAPCVALITACNPQSRLLGDDENRARMARLEARLQRSGWQYEAACSNDPDGVWPDEPGLAVWALPLAVACEFAAGFGQNALIWAGEDAIPRLILLR